MSEEKKNVDTRTATQRLADLENGLGQLYRTVDFVTQDLSLIKNALKLLDNKLNAFIKVTVDGETVTDEKIDETMIDNNIADLANKVTNMVIQGIIAPEQVVSENSFLVGTESDGSGKVTNPRVQFPLQTLAAEIKAKFVGAKVGDALTFQEGKLTFTILEAYKINEPTPAPEPTPEVTSEPAALPVPEVTSSEPSVN